MDTPLSYSTPLIVDSMTVYRGIAPVSAGMNTLGGAIDVKMRKAEAMNSSNSHVSGDLQAGCRSNNSAKTLSAVTNMAKDNIAVMALLLPRLILIKCSLVVMFVTLVA